MRNSGCDPSLHAIESSKSPNDHLKDYYEADTDDDGNESEFVVESPRFLSQTFHFLFKFHFHWILF